MANDFVMKKNHSLAGGQLKKTNFTTSSLSSNEIKQITQQYDEIYNYNLEGINQNQSSNSDSELSKKELFSLNDITDKQYNILASMSYTYITKSEKFKNGKKLSEVDVTETIGSGENEKKVNMYDYYGIGDLTIVESYIGEDGYACLVLKDDFGNYLMINPCTNEPKVKTIEGKTVVENYEDLLYDFYPLLVELGVYDTQLSDLEIDNILSLVFSLVGLSNLDLGEKPLEYIEKIYKSQRKQAEEFTEKYYNQALSEGKQLSFFGYSKGGGLSEYSYLSCVDYESSNQVLSEIILYNPFHDDLDSEEVKILKDNDDLTLYRNQGDFVSTIFNEHDFEEDTVYIKCDWKNLYSDPEQTSLFDKISEAIHGKPHQPGSSSKDAYDEEGNAVKADSYEYSDVSNFLFGTKDVINFTKVGVKIAEPLVNGFSLLFNVVDNVTEYVEKQIDYTGEYFDDVASSTINYVDNISNSTSEFTKNVSNWNSVDDVLVDTLSYSGSVAWDSIVFVSDVAWDSIEYAWDGFTNGVETAWENTCDIAEYAWNGVTSGIEYVWNGITSW